MGVWIETEKGSLYHDAMEVTPCVGVWIETYGVMPEEGEVLVTPCVGVWIETSFMAASILAFSSHPAWVCGLKRLLVAVQASRFRHTLRGCVD